MKKNNEKPKLLLHVCCAPCSGFLVSELARDFDVTIFYFNPNIFPESEYERRKSEARHHFMRENIHFIEDEYGHGEWLEMMVGLENEPEKGKRCIVCYHMRLRRAAHYAKKHDFDYFAASLSMSPHKSSTIINNLGRSLEKETGVKFLAEDWKKKDGYKKAVSFSEDRGFYRQKYCGCEFSQGVEKK